MHAPLEWHTIDRHFAGQSTPEEAEAISRWVAEDAARAAELEAMHRLWLAAAMPESPRFDVNAGWRAMQPRMREVTPLERAPSAVASRPPLRLLGAERPRARWRRPAALAAAVILMVSTATLS
ncbi:MAG TPA: hypothetical protein VHQ45_16425, partial [Gemmatimonadaceae bacterium]|nr:hypothetical protein [Gemmatimonadaceae bacterium]